jgi:nicotinate-nucleotide adenylyltransferase
VLLFGGVFDPPHAGHVVLAGRVRDEMMGGAQLVFVPAAQSPHKPGGAVASDVQRLAMLELAIRDVPNCSIWTDEIDRGGPSYWVQTLARARDELGDGVAFRFLIGADQAVAFHRWRAFREVLACAEPIVMLREPMGSVAALQDALREAGVWSTEEMARWRSWVWTGGLVDVSSTQVRDRFHRGGSGGGRLDDLDPQVRAYVEQEGLYVG